MMIRNIKKIKNNKDTFWEHLTHFSSVFASIREAVVFIDTKGKIVMANPAIELLTGRVPSECIGAPVLDILMLSCTKSDMAQLMRDAIEGWRAIEFPDECSITHTNGSSISVAAVTTPLYEDDGTYVGIILLMRDISKDIELKHQQYAFFSFATHQMRQPLAYMRLGIEGLLTRKEKFDVDQQEVLEELLRVVLKSAKFVKEFLDLSRLEQGRIDLVITEVDIRKLLEEICRELKNFAISKNISLQLFLNNSDQTPCIIHGDAERLRDVFHNLITNAISYNHPNGKVSIDAFTTSAKEAAKRAVTLHGSEDFQSYFTAFSSSENSHATQFLILTVGDTGLGIPAGDLASIFHTFFRAGNVKKEGLQGTGLGLSIVKSIVERSGGRIGFESKEGVFTIFYLFFPLYSADPRVK